MLYKIYKSIFFLPKRNFHYLSPYVTSSFHYPQFPITNLNLKYNLNYNDIRKEELINKEGNWTDNAVFSIDTGNITGRSPHDKYIVCNSPSKEKVWWGHVNKPMTSKTFNRLKELCIHHFDKNVNKYYIFDGYCGANKKTRKKVRFITEHAWQHHFVKNMFITSGETDFNNFSPDMTIINACQVKNPNWKEDKLHSENFICFDIEKKLGLIGGTQYAGEMKKGIFSLMNYWLPQQGILPMHCSANRNKYGETTLFFGLSGTGKTTLSTDMNTDIIGDDEHGWDDEGIFNFEGGCYAKTLNLKEKNEPLIYNAITSNAILENVSLDPVTNKPQYDNSTKTENGRVSYPLSHLPNTVLSSIGPHPRNIIFLTCDMYGVLPSVSKLSKEQAIYYFLSGYTSKVGGTESGISSPEATFSAAFGGAFLTLPPEQYGNLLYKKLKEHDCNVFLVNTGWCGGQYGVGERYSIQKTRAIINDIMSGNIHKQPMKVDEQFGFTFPVKEDPEQFWKDKNQFKIRKKKLIMAFQENFTKNKFSSVFEKYQPNL